MKVTLLNSQLVLNEAVKLKNKSDFIFNNKDYITDKSKIIRVTHFRTMISNILEDDLSSESSNFSFTFYIQQLSNLNNKFSSQIYSIYEEVKDTRKNSLQKWNQKKLKLSLSTLKKVSKKD